VSVQFRAAKKTSYSGLNTSSFTITKPVGTLDGDLMILYWSAQNTVVPNTLSGWTLLRSDSYDTAAETNSVYYKVASGEGATWAWTTPSGTRAAVTVVSLFNENASPIDAQGFQGNAASTTITGPTLTIAEAGEVILWFGGYGASTAARVVTQPAGYTVADALATADNSTVFAGHLAAYLLNPSTGSTGAINGSMTHGDPNYAFAISIKALPANAYQLLLASM